MTPTWLERQLDVEVHLGDSTVVEAAELPVRLVVHARRPVTVADAEVELVRTVTYRFRQGNVYGGAYTATGEQSQTIDRCRVPIDHPLAAGERVEHWTYVTVPEHGPGTVDAQLVTVTWAVTALLRPVTGRVAEARRTVHVLSAAADLPALRAARLEHGDLADLAITDLPHRRFGPGDGISGTLVATPASSGSIRTIRAELVLVEHVTAGPWEGEEPSRLPADEDRWAETVAATRVLAEHVALEAGRPLTLPFLLRAPDPLPAPSVSFPHFTLSWELRISLTRHLHHDTRLTVEMHGQTVPPTHVRD